MVKTNYNFLMRAKARKYLSNNRTLSISRIVIVLTVLMLNFACNEKVKMVTDVAIIENILQEFTITRIRSQLFAKVTPANKVLFKNILEQHDIEYQSFTSLLKKNNPQIYHNLFQ